MIFQRLRNSVEYRCGRRLGARRRAAYERKLRDGSFLTMPTKNGGMFPTPVYCLCGRNQLAEAVASLHSFFVHAGTPVSFTIVSDGSLTGGDEQLLMAAHPSIRVISRREVLADRMPAGVGTYVETGQPLGFKLAALLFISSRAPAIYTDSDVLFFPGAREALNRMIATEQHPCYMKDASAAFDDRLFESATEAKRHPVNSGFLYFDRPLDWSLGVARLGRLTALPTFFTEQTVVHLTMHQNQGRFLDPQRFVIQLDDQFRLRDGYAGPTIAARHYVSPVRHKFWLRAPQQ